MDECWELLTDEQIYLTRKRMQRRRSDCATEISRLRRKYEQLGPMIEEVFAEEIQRQGKEVML